MPFLVNKTPAQRNKLILAIVLGSVALFFLQRVFFNSSSSNRAARRPRPAGTRTNSPPSNRSGAPAPTSPQQRRDDPLVAPQPIDYHWRPPAAPPVGRNIFAYYIAPCPSPKLILRLSACFCSIRSVAGTFQRKFKVFSKRFQRKFKVFSKSAAGKKRGLFCADEVCGSDSGLKAPLTNCKTQDATWNACWRKRSSDYQHESSPK